MKNTYLIILVLLSGIIFFSCSDNSTSSKDELDVDNSVVEEATIGYEINDIANTTSEVDELTDPSEMEFNDFGAFSKKSFLINQTKEFTKVAREIVAEKHSLSKTANDSLAFFSSDTLLGKITRTYWYFDDETDSWRIEIAIEYLNPLRRVTYDSSSIIFSEDKLISTYNLKLFKETFILQKIETNLTANTWDESNEVTGFTAVSTSTYKESSRVVSVTHTLTVNSDGSGTISQQFVFDDSTSSSFTVTYSDGEGTFSREFRNGTTETGSFNDAKDDGIGSYESLTSFPDGFYIASIFKSANIVLNRQLKTATTDLLRVITFSNGNVDSTVVNIMKNRDSDATTISINAAKSNGAYGSLLITKTPDFATLEGTWTTWDSLYIVINGERYDDGSSWLTYSVYENEDAYNNGDDPIADAEYNFYADGGGEGRFTHRGKRFDMVLDGTGRGEIIRDGARRAINLHRR